MKYSFVIPTYNNKALLLNTLEALNYQSPFKAGDFEAVIVDDGSNDNTYEYIKGINRNYSLRYFYIERNNSSCRAKTRNHGWKNASGEIIAFIDSDILVKTDYLYELNRCFSLSSDILVLGNRLMLDKPADFGDIASGEVFNKFHFASGNFKALEYRYFLFEMTSYNSSMMILPWTQVYSCNLAVPKKWLEETGGFDENFKGWGVEDIELGYSLYKKKVRIVINSRLEVLHQYHGDRNDLIITLEKIPGYDRNLEYFIAKHPVAVKMGKKYVFKFLKGEISDDKLFMDARANYVDINISNSDDPGIIMERALKTSSDGKFIPVINDFNENTDIDILLQLPGQASYPVKYYPMSKRLDRKKMVQFLKIEKNRQRQAASKT